MKYIWFWINFTLKSKSNTAHLKVLNSSKSTLMDWKANKCEDQNGRALILVSVACRNCKSICLGSRLFEVSHHIIVSCVLKMLKFRKWNQFNEKKIDFLQMNGRESMKKSNLPDKMALSNGSYPFKSFAFISAPYSMRSSATSSPSNRRSKQTNYSAIYFIVSIEICAITLTDNHMQRCSAFIISCVHISPMFQ